MPRYKHPGGGGSAPYRPSPVPWDIAFLRAIGAPITLNNRSKLWTWTTFELGPDAATGGWDYKANMPRFNWFDSTLPWPRSSNCLSCSQQSVQRYATPSDGVAANVATLTKSNPRYGYGAVIANLQQNGSYEGFGQALANSCAGGCGWGGYPGWNAGRVWTDPSKVTTANIPTNGSTPAARGGAGGSNVLTFTSCNVAVSGRNDNKVFVIPHTDTGITKCQLKALKGAILLGLGGAVFLVGSALVISGLAKGQVPQPIRQAAGLASKIGPMRVASAGRRTKRATFKAERKQAPARAEERTKQEEARTTREVAKTTREESRTVRALNKPAAKSRTRGYDPKGGRAVRGPTPGTGKAEPRKVGGKVYDAEPF